MKKLPRGFFACGTLTLVLMAFTLVQLAPAAGASWIREWEAMDEEASRHITRFDEGVKANRPEESFKEYQAALAILDRMTALAERHGDHDRAGYSRKKAQILRDLLK